MSRPPPFPPRASAPPLRTRPQRPAMKRPHPDQTYTYLEPVDPPFCPPEPTPRDLYDPQYPQYAEHEGYAYEDAEAYEDALISEAFQRGREEAWRELRAAEYEEPTHRPLIPPARRAPPPGDAPPPLEPRRMGPPLGRSGDPPVNSARGPPLPPRRPPFSAPRTAPLAPRGPPPVAAPRAPPLAAARAPPALAAPRAPPLAAARAPPLAAPRGPNVAPRAPPPLPVAPHLAAARSIPIDLGPPASAPRASAPPFARPSAPPLATPRGPPSSAPPFAPRAVAPPLQRPPPVRTFRRSVPAPTGQTNAMAIGRETRSNFSREDIVGPKYMKFSEDSHTPAADDKAAAAGGTKCYNCGLIQGHWASVCPHSDKVCYNCEGTGHISRDCPNRTMHEVNCYDCGEKGHLTKNCPAMGRLRLCYNCQQYTGHASKDCPFPRGWRARGDNNSAGSRHVDPSLRRGLSSASPAPHADAPPAPAQAQLEAMSVAARRTRRANALVANANHTKPAAKRSFEDFHQQKEQFVTQIACAAQTGDVIMREQGVALCLRPRKTQGGVPYGVRFALECIPDGESDFRLVNVSEKTETRQLVSDDPNHKVPEKERDAVMHRMTLQWTHQCVTCHMGISRNCFKCRVCRDFTNRDTLHAFLLHLFIVHRLSLFTSIRCPYCHEECGDPEQFDQHMCSVHYVHPGCETVDHLICKDKEQACRACFPSYEERAAHMRMVHPCGCPPPPARHDPLRHQRAEDGFCCTKCDRIIYSENQYNLHVQDPEGCKGPHEEKLRPHPDRKTGARSGRGIERYRLWLSKHPNARMHTVIYKPERRTAFVKAGGVGVYQPTRGECFQVTTYPEGYRGGNYQA